MTSSVVNHPSDAEIIKDATEAWRLCSRKNFHRDYNLYESSCVQCREIATALARVRRETWEDAIELVNLHVFPSDAAAALKAMGTVLLTLRARAKVAEEAPTSRGLEVEGKCDA